MSKNKMEIYKKVFSDESPVFYKVSNDKDFLKEAFGIDQIAGEYYDLETGKMVDVNEMMFVGTNPDEVELCELDSYFRKGVK